MKRQIAIRSEALCCKNCGAPFGTEENTCMYCDSSKPHHLIVPGPPKNISPRSKNSLFLYVLIFLLFFIIIYKFAMIETFSFKWDKSGEIPSKILPVQKKLQSNGDNDVIKLKFGILSYHAFPKTIPAGFDSLISIDSLDDIEDGSYMEIGLAGGELAIAYLSGSQLQKLASTGLDHLMYISHDRNPAGKGDCSRGSLKDLIDSRLNRVSGATVFMSSDANGCGVPVHFSDIPPGERIPVMVWTGGTERLTGKWQPKPYDLDGNTALMAVGIGKSSNLFDQSRIGSLDRVPIYPGADQDGDRGYMAVFAIGKYKNKEIIIADRIRLVDILGGHGQPSNELAVEIK